MRKILLSLLFFVFASANAWGATRKGNITYSTSGSTLIISPVAETDGVMGDYKDFDGSASASEKRPAAWSYGITNIDIKEGVTSIGKYAFQGITNITSVHIPSTLTSINSDAFLDCTGMKKIYYAGSPSDWADITFSNQTAHPFGALTSSQEYFFYGETSTRTKTIVLTPTITEIKPYAFQRGWFDGNGIYIPGTVSSIGTHAFYGLNLSGGVWINRETAPGLGTDAFYFGGKKNLCVPAGATGYNTSAWTASGKFNTPTTQKIGEDDFVNTETTIKWSLDENCVLTINATSGPKSLTFDLAGNAHPWGNFRRLVYKIKVQGEITDLGDLLRYHYNLSEVVVDQNAIPACSGKIASTTDGPSYGVLFDPRSSTKLKLTIRSASLGDDSADNLGDAPWSDDKWDIQLSDNVVLSDGADNSTLISNLQTYFAGKTFTLQLGRSLTNAQYNTFCSPIALTKAQLNDADIRKLESSSLDGEDLTLTFSASSLDAIEAGKPYLVKPSSAVANPTFENIDPSDLVSATENTETDFVDFIGVLAPTGLTGGDHNTLFLGAGNELFWPEADGNIGGMRAYFSVNEAAQKNGIKARIVMNKEVATGIETVSGEGLPVTGKKILRNGQLFIIRDGKTYNVQGQLVK